MEKEKVLASNAAFGTHTVTMYLQDLLKVLGGKKNPEWNCRDGGSHLCLLKPEADVIYHPIGLLE